MSFKRNDVQEFVEYEQGCLDVSKWAEYKFKLLTWEINNTNINKLKRCSKSDLNSYFLKALQTFSQAIHEINQSKFTWAIIKLYYTTFYLLRCEILLSNHILVRCKSLYYAKLKEGEKLVHFNKRGSDHQLTISFVKKLYDEREITDPILGNDINGINAYSWLMKNRERVNYQMKSFSDPYPDNSLSHLKSYFDDESLGELFDFYNKNSDYSICFDVQHSILSIPYKKLKQIRAKMGTKLDLTDLEKRQLVSCFKLSSDMNINRKKIEELIV